MTGASESTIADVCAVTEQGLADWSSSDLAVSPDGKFIAYTTCAAGGLQQRGMLLDVANNTTRPLDDAAAIREVGFSDDGHFVHFNAHDRVAGPATFQPHVESTDGVTKKSIAFFEESAPAPELYLERRIGKVGVSVSPDGKTAIAFGVERDQWGEKDIGRIVVASLDSDGQTSFLAPTSPQASATWPSSGDQVVLTRLGGENNVLMQVVSLGDMPAVADTSWMAKGLAAADQRYTLIPGSYDGSRVLRWDRDESDSSRDRGWYVIVNADGTLVQLSRDSSTVARMPRVLSSNELRTNDVRAAIWTKVDGKPAVLFPGQATDEGPTDLLVRALDGQATVIATDVRAREATAGARTPVGTDGAFLYPSTGGIRLADGKGATKAFFGTDRSRSTIVAINEDRSRVLVRSVNRDNSPYDVDPTYNLVDVATSAAIPLTLTPSAWLRPFGSLTDPWSNEDCLHDGAKIHGFARDGALFMFTYYGARSAFCKREQPAPGLMRFGMNGALDGLVTAPDLARVKETSTPFAAAPQLHPLDERRVVVASCGLTGKTCGARILSLPAAGSGAEPPAPAPAPTDPSPSPGEAKPNEPPTPAPAPPAKEGTGTEPTPATTPASTATASASCATTRGTRSSGAGLGLGLVLAAAALVRRRARRCTRPHGARCSWVTRSRSVT